MSEECKSGERIRRRQPMSSWKLLIALLAALGLLAAACGDDLGSQKTITLASNP